MAEERLIFPVGFDLESGVKDASEEWKRVQKQMQAAIDSRPISVNIDAKEIRKFNTFIERTYASLENLQDLFPEVFKESKDGENITKQFQAMETSINAVNEEMRNLEKVWNNLSMEEKYDKDGNLTAKAQQLKQAYVELYQSQKTQGQTLAEITKEAIALADREIEQAEKKKAKEQEFLRLLSLEENTLANIKAKQSAWMSRLSTTQIGSDEWKSAVAEVQRLDAQIKKLQNTIKGTKGKAKIDIDTSTFAGKLKDLENRWKSLTAAQRKGAEGEALRQEWRQLAAEAGNYTSTLRSAVSAQDKLSNSQDKSTASIKKQNLEYKRQMNYIERLITRMGVYFGIHQFASMLRSIRETTAEFELQEVALGAIIQDAHDAQVLFSQIQAAAVESPYQIKELVNYTKQLAAYGFEQNELFNTTMKLADISAGLGADMSRIILAVGQISAATVLKGTELRQLTELGIPMVELLAKKFTQLRGEVVSTGEVFEMISDKAVSFKMVEEVLNDLTSAGGMFYDMQRKQAETLAGQWSNLKDSIAIAYDEIGNTGTVRGAMEGVISLLKSMADNWQRTAAVLSGLVTGIATYVAAVKSAALVEALRNRTLADNIKLVRASVTVQPKWVAAIIGETRAKTLNLAMTKALRIARLKEVAATNVASKAFWRLTAAMMSNPYAIVIAAIAALGFTIFNMAKNTRTAEESVDDLNESVASLSKLNNSVKPLVDELDALSSKAEKTADEQKRLNQVTQELANRYPAAISAVKEYGKEVDITAGKVRSLYEAETEAAKKGTEALLEENEKVLVEQKAQYDRLVSAIARGTKTVTTAGGMFGGGVSYETALTSEELSAMKKEMDELGLSIQNTESAIKSAKIELGLLPSEAQQNIDAFGAWRKELEGFILSYKTADGQDIQFFDDEQIGRFNNLNDALAETVKIRKENTDAVAKYNETLKSTTISEDTRTRITQEKANAQAHIDTADAIIKHFNAYSLLQEAKGKEDRTPLQVLNEEVSLLEKVYAKYKEFLKYMSSADAKAKTEEYFADTIGSLRFGAAFDTTKLKEILTKYQDAARSLPESDKTVLELGFKVDDVSWQETLDDMKDRVAELADAVARSKEAKDFYDKMLGMTGDRQLSADLTMSVYGGVGDDLQKNIKAQLENAFEGVNIKPAFDGDKIDWSQLNDLVESIPIESKREEARKLVNEGIKDNARWLQDLYKTYEKFQTYEERRTAVIKREEELRKQIRENASLKPEEQEKQIVASRKREQAETLAIDIEEFKASKDWAKSFEEVENLATPTIERLMEKLKGFMDLNAVAFAENPEQLRTLMNEYQKLYDAIVERNPFTAISDGIKEYVEATQKLTNARQRLAEAAEGTREYADAAEDLADAQDEQQKALAKTQKGFQAASSAISNLGNLMTELIDIFGIAEDSEFGAFIQDLVKWLGVMATVLGLVASIIAIIEAELAPLLAVAAAIAAVGAAISWLSDAKVRKANREIEKQEELLKRLSRSYEKLEKAAESAFGTEYIDNYRERLELLQAEAEAYAKQIEAEQSKGKDKDDEAIDDYEEARQETLDKLDEAQKEIAERMLGTDLGSAARDFADAWLEAYKEFGNTSDAIGKKFEEMIDNMLVESAIAGVMKTALEPVFNLMKGMDIYDEDWIKNFNDTVAKAKENALVGSELVANALEQGGILSREMGENLSGISKDIATASEESILGLAAGINTQNFYISQIHAAVLRMEMLMQSGGTGVNIQDLVTIQNQHLAHLPNIAANTANTLQECRAILTQVTDIATNLGRVIVPNGTSSSHQVRTTLS